MAAFQLLKNRVYVLDGGFSSQISRHVGTTADGDPLWSARFLQTNQDDVVKTHLDFIKAGADIISTNTYQASVDGFVKHLGVSEDQGFGIIRRAVELAKSARDKYKEECIQNNVPYRDILIAGSFFFFLWKKDKANERSGHLMMITAAHDPVQHRRSYRCSVGPYGAYLHDGSEYTGAYADRTPEKVMAEWHKPRIETLIISGVDLLAFETIPCQKEAIVLINILKDYPNMKAWISLSCKDDNCLAHGEHFQTVARNCWKVNSEQLIAVGVNCCSPKIVANLINGISKDIEPPIPIVTYPNSGEKYNPQMGWIDKDKCESLDTFVSHWLNLGVRFIGGCCRTYAEDITNIRTQVEALTPKLS